MFMKKFSLTALFAPIAVIIVMALIMIGVSQQNVTLIVTGLALGFVAVLTVFPIASIKKIKKRFPLRNDPFQKKIRAAHYLKSFSPCVIMIGMVMEFFGTSVRSSGTTLYLYIAWALLFAGFAMAITGSIVLAAISKQMPASRMVYNAASVSAPGISAAQIPSSPDPIISRILENPYVLLDERIRRLHEVQNLLQYPEIQQVFFEPTKLYSLFDQKRVETLLNIVSGWISQNNAEEIFAAAEQRRSANSPMVTTQPGGSVGKTNSRNGMRENPVAAVISVIVFLVILVTVVIITVVTNHG